MAVYLSEHLDMEHEIEGILIGTDIEESALLLIPHIDLKIGFRPFSTEG